MKYFVLGKKGNQPKNGLGLSDSSVSGWGQDYLTFQCNDHGESIVIASICYPKLEVEA